MRNKKKTLKNLMESVDKNFGDASDFHIVWKLTPDDSSGANIIESTLVSGLFLKECIRAEKLDQIEGKSKGLTEQKLYELIKKYSNNLKPGLEYLEAVTDDKVSI